MLFPVQWSPTTYGLDGPWHAISALVGGYDPGSDPKQAAVDLLPGGFWQSYILSNVICTPTTNATGDCAKGGSWDPTTIDGGSLSEQTADGSIITVRGAQNNIFGSGRTMSGKIYQQKLHLNGFGPYKFGDYPRLTVPNSTLVSVTDGYQTWPNGRATSLELGSLALGADDPQMNFTRTNASTIVTYNVPGYLKATNNASDSYAIQIGAAQVGFSGSLIFGGYDKGRGLGPITSWSGNPPLMLHDLVLGVETGGSPWNFTTKTGLLLNNQSMPAQLPVYPEPLAPYLHLPDATCKGLARVLPLYFDETSRYYLWNTSDPLYTTIIQSATYLGFVFPAASVGSSDEFTIKVPFLYLNLTLMPAASGLAAPVQYFPCQNYVPDYGPVVSGGAAGGTYTLGRAFLQAAILGRNWAKGVSWLAQAAGPGPNKQGLSYTPTEIGDSDTSISFDPDTSLFNKTMQKYWTPLPDTSSTAAGTQDGGLSTGAKAGIAVGAAVLILVVIGIGILLFLRRKTKRSRRAVPAVQLHHGDVKPPVYAAVQQHEQYMSHAKDGPTMPVKEPEEMDGHTHAGELETRPPHELDGNRYDLR